MGIFDSLRNLFGGNQSQGQGNIFSLDGLREWNDRIYNQQQGHTFGGEKYLKNYDEINRGQLHRIHQNIMSYQNGWFSQGQNSILGGQQVSSLTSSSIFPKKQQPTTSIIQSIPSGKQPIALLTASPTAPSISVGGQQNFNSTYEQDLSFPETKSWTGAQNSIEKANRVFSTKWYQNDSAVEAGGPLKTYEQSKAPTSGPFSLDTYRGRTKDIAVYNEENTGRKNDVGTDLSPNNQRTNINAKTTKQETTAFSVNNLKNDQPITFGNTHNVNEFGSLSPERWYELNQSRQSILGAIEEGKNYRITRDKNGNLFPWLKGSKEQEPKLKGSGDQVKLEQQTNNSPRRKISEKQDVDLANQMHQGAIEARNAREISQSKELSDKSADRIKRQQEEEQQRQQEEEQQWKEEQQQQEIKKQQPVASKTDNPSPSNEVQEQSKPGLFSRIRDHFSPGKDDYGNYSDIKKAWKKSADSDDARIERFSSVAQSRKEAFEKANQEKYKDLKGSDREKKLFNDFIESERGMLQSNNKKYMQAYGSFLNDTQKTYNRIDKHRKVISDRREGFSQELKKIKASGLEHASINEMASVLGGGNTERIDKINQGYHNRAVKAINEERKKANEKLPDGQKKELIDIKNVSGKDSDEINAKVRSMMQEKLEKRNSRLNKIENQLTERQGRIMRFDSDAIAGHKVGNGHFKGKVGAVVGLLALGGIIGNQFAGGHQTNAQLYNPSPQPQYYS